MGQEVIDENNPGIYRYKMVESSEFVVSQKVATAD